MAEGGGLLNRCTVKSCTQGSNPCLSASSCKVIQHNHLLFVFVQSFTPCSVVSRSRGAKFPLKTVKFSRIRAVKGAAEI